MCSDGRSPPLDRSARFRHVSPEISVMQDCDEPGVSWNERTFMRRATLRRMSVSFQFRARSVRMQYGDRPCLRTFVLMTTADTAAELGCKRWQNARACVCRTIRPAADRGKAVPALPATASSFFYDRQVFSGISAVPAAGSRRRVLWQKKTQEQEHLTGTV